MNGEINTAQHSTSQMQHKNVAKKKKKHIWRFVTPD